MSPGSEYGPVMGFYEGCNEYSFSIKKRNFVTVFSTTSLLKFTVIHGVSYEHKLYNVRTLDYHRRRSS